mmetsp:Transcript_21887/g.46178  ORF Transcript_21887/g.46178 Transcript_21887/m.46178 type:complete len:202 (+) Transcript_21887:1253-1858(+)
MVLLPGRVRGPQGLHDCLAGRLQGRPERDRAQPARRHAGGTERRLRSQNLAGWRCHRNGPSGRHSQARTVPPGHRNPAGPLHGRRRGPRGHSANTGPELRRLRHSNDHLPAGQARLGPRRGRHEVFRRRQRNHGRALGHARPRDLGTLFGQGPNDQVVDRECLYDPSNRRHRVGFEKERVLIDLLKVNEKEIDEQSTISIH